MTVQKHELQLLAPGNYGRWIFAVVLAVALFAAQSAHAVEYALTDLYRIALQRSERVAVANEDVSVAGQGRQAAHSAFLPKVSAFGSYTRYSTEQSASFGGANILIQPAGAAAWGLTVDKSLSLGGRELTSYRIAGEEIEKSRRDLDAVKERDVFAVAVAYFDLLRTQKALDMAKTNLDRLTKHRDAAAVRLRVGEVTKTDLLRAEAELSGARSDLVREENLVKLAKAVLARVTGLTGAFEVKAPDSQAARAPAGIDLLKEAAFANRAELKSCSLQRKISEERVATAKSAYWPTLSVQGAYQGFSQEPSLPFAVKDSLWAGVAINIPIFEGGLRKAEVGQAEARSRRSVIVCNDLRKSVAIEVDRAWLDYQTQQGALQSLRDQQKFAADNFYSVSKQYQFGLANSIDVIDANSLLLTAQRQLIDAELNYLLSMVRVQAATGELLKAALPEEK